MIYRTWMEAEALNAVPPDPEINLQRARINYRRGIITPDEAYIEWYGDDLGMQPGIEIVLYLKHYDGTLHSTQVFQGRIKRIGRKKINCLKNFESYYAYLSSGTNRKFSKKVDISLFDLENGITYTDVINAGIDECPDFGSAREFQFRGKYIEALEKCFRMAGYVLQAGGGNLGFELDDLSGIEEYSYEPGIKAIRGGVLRGTLNKPKEPNSDVVIKWSPLQEQWWNIATWSGIDEEDNYYVYVMYMGYIHHEEVRITDLATNVYGDLKLDGTSVSYTWYDYDTFKTKNAYELISEDNGYAIISPDKVACYSYFLIKKKYTEEEAKLGNIFAKFKSELPQVAELTIHGDKFLEHFGVGTGEYADVEMTYHDFPSIGKANKYLENYINTKNMTTQRRYRFKYGMKKVIPQVSHEIAYTAPTYIVEEVNLNWSIGEDASIDTIVLEPAVYDADYGDAIGLVKDLLKIGDMKLEGNIVRHEANGAVVVIQIGDGENAKEYKILKALPYVVFNEKSGMIIMR